MDIGLALSTTLLFLISFFSFSVEMQWYTEFTPPDTGGPDSSTGSGTHLSS